MQEREQSRVLASPALYSLVLEHVEPRGPNEVRVSCQMRAHSRMIEIL